MNKHQFKEIGFLFRNERKKSNLPMKAIAYDTDLSNNTINRMEHGIIGNLEPLIKLSKYYKITIKIGDFEL